MNVPVAAKTANTYDAIVIGSGISGGWAAKELSEKGLKTLVLERGRDVKHGDYPTAFMESWDFKGRTKLPVVQRARQEKQNRTGYTTAPASAHWFVDDVDHPYAEEKRFDWMRGYHVGGRSQLWGRQSYRLSDLDFEAEGTIFYTGDEVVSGCNRRRLVDSRELEEEAFPGGQARRATRSIC